MDSVTDGVDLPSPDSGILAVWLVGNWIKVRYCSDATSHSRGQHSRVCGIIYARDQAKFFESSEFARELTQPSKHFFLFK